MRPWGFFGVILALSSAGTTLRADVVVLDPSQDATLVEHPDGAFANGSGQHFFAGRTSQGTPDKRRGLISFDVARDIPRGSTITRAALTLVKSSGQPGTHRVGLFRVLNSWDEGPTDPPGGEGAGDLAVPGDVTWVHRSYDDHRWAQPGGDHHPLPSASLLVGENGIYTWTSQAMLEDVQSWLDKPALNYGWMLIGDELVTGSSKKFESRQHPDPEVHPRLTVEFRPAATPDLNADGRVGGGDLALLLAAWGPLLDGPEDLNHDGAVDMADLARLLAAWDEPGTE